MNGFIENGAARRGVGGKEGDFVDELSDARVVFRGLGKGGAAEGTSKN